MSAKKRKQGLFKKPLIALLLVLALLLVGYFARDYIWPQIPSASSIGEVPAYSGYPLVYINDNVPEFTEDEITTESYEFYSPLDALGRCGVAIACIGVDLMPTEDREEIGHVEPSGWNQAQYDCIPGNGWLYNRCHLIGFRLTAENDNERNLITGTVYMNTDPDGMYGIEEKVDEYLTENPDNHVMYRVTPIFEGYEYVARGVQIEAYSVEDEGEGICFNVFCYNVQPGVEIDYYDGSSWETGETPPPKDEGNNDNNAGDGSGDASNGEVTYIINTNSKKIHLTTCRYADSNNTEETTKTLEELLAENYTACGTCKPDKSK